MFSAKRNHIPKIDVCLCVICVLSFRCIVIVMYSSNRSNECTLQQGARKTTLWHRLTILLSCGALNYCNHYYYRVYIIKLCRQEIFQKLLSFLSAFLCRSLFLSCNSLFFRNLQMIWSMKTEHNHPLGE